MSKLLARVRVLLTAAPSWLTGLAVLVAAVRDEVGDAFPGVSDEVGAVAAPVLAAIAAAVAIVRRVTPVLPDERGLLPGGDA